MKFQMAHALRIVFALVAGSLSTQAQDGDARVAAFLMENKLDRWLPEFTTNEVEWGDLSSLSREDLIDMGIKAIGPRNRVLKAISMLSNDDSQEASKFDNVIDASKTSKADKGTTKLEEKTEKNTWKKMKKAEKASAQDQRSAEKIQNAKNAKKKHAKKKKKKKKEEEEEEEAKSSCMVAWSPVPLDEDEDDRPVSSTGHTMLTRKGGLWLFGGIVFHDTGGKQSQQLGHVLWNFDTQDSAWERHVPSGGMRLNRLKYNDSIEVQYIHGESSSGVSDAATMRDSVAPADWYQAHVREIDLPKDRVKVRMLHPLKSTPEKPQYMKRWIHRNRVRNFPPASSMHIAALSKASTKHGGEVMYIFGGKPKSGKITSDVWAYSFDDEVWSQLQPSRKGKGKSKQEVPTTPAAREMLCGDVLGGGLLIFGGVRGRTIFGDLWHFGFKTNVWTQLKKSDDKPWPSARYGSSSVSVGERMYVFGGMDEGDEGGVGSALDELWSFDWSSMEWTLHSPSIAVSGSGSMVDSTQLARKGHAAALYGENVMLVYGGSGDGFTFFGDTVGLDLVRMEWHNLTDASAFIPAPRNFHRIAVSNGMLYMFGGNNADGIQKDFYQAPLCSDLELGFGTTATAKLEL
jgi:hypothetical protein